MGSIFCSPKTQSKILPDLKIENKAVDLYGWLPFNFHYPLKNLDSVYEPLIYLTTCLLYYNHYVSLAPAGQILYAFPISSATSFTFSFSSLFSYVQFSFSFSTFLYSLMILEQTINTQIFQLVSLTSFNYKWEGLKDALGSRKAKVNMYLGVNLTILNRQLCSVCMFKRFAGF